MRPSRLLLIVSAAVFSAFAANPFHPATVARNGSVEKVGQMLEPRSGHVATLLPNGNVLIAGGMRRNQDFYRSAELYDPTNKTFHPTGEMNEPRVSPIAVLLKLGKVLVAGGWIGHGCTNSAEVYDPSTGRFTLLASKMTAVRGDARGTLLESGDVLITGGADHDSPGGVASAEVFHPATMTFEAVGPMHFARVSHTATLLLDGRVLIVGGRGNEVNAIAEIYDPKTRHFSDTGSLTTARYKHTAGRLSDGRVLIAGGSDERDWTGNLGSTEIYDPKTGKFSSGSALNEARFKLPEDAVQLSSGRLLVAGGSKEVEVFDPVSCHFLLASGEISNAWHFMTETKLEDGTVFLAGGYANNDRATAEAWIYRP